MVTLKNLIVVKTNLNRVKTKFLKESGPYRGSSLFLETIVVRLVFGSKVSLTNRKDNRR